MGLRQYYQRWQVSSNLYAKLVVNGWWSYRTFGVKFWVSVLIRISVVNITNSCIMWPIRVQNCVSRIRTNCRILQIVGMLQRTLCRHGHLFWQACMMYRYDAKILLGSRGTYCRMVYKFVFLFATRRSYLRKEHFHSGKKCNFLLLTKYSRSRLQRYERDWIFCVVINECHYNRGV
jgi:hypothetical protein